MTKEPSPSELFLLEGTIYAAVTGVGSGMECQLGTLLRPSLFFRKSNIADPLGRSATSFPETPKKGILSSMRQKAVISP